MHQFGSFSQTAKLRAKLPVAGTPEGLLLVLPAVLCLLAVLIIVPASSAQAAEPGQWSMENGVAARHLPDGNTVTASYEGPGVMNADGGFLSFEIADCTSSCGTLTSSFQRPVQDVGVTIADMGASTRTAGGNYATYHNHPVSVRNATFQTRTQSARLAITNGGQTVEIANPGQYAQPDEPGAASGLCAASGAECGDYSILTDTPTVSSLVLDFGYNGTGTTTDLIRLALTAEPGPANVQLSVKSVGGGGTFAYGLDNLSNGRDTVTTMADGHVGNSAQVNTVLDPTRPVTLIPEFSHFQSEATCSHSGASGAGGSSSAAQFVGSKLVLPPSMLIAGQTTSCILTVHVPGSTVLPVPSPKPIPTTAPVPPSPSPISPTAPDLPQLAPSPTVVPEKPADPVKVEAPSSPPAPGKPEVMLNKSTETGGPVTVGEKITYELELRNHEASAIKVKTLLNLNDVLDDAAVAAGPTLEGSAAGLQVTEAGGLYTLAGELPAGESARLVLAVKVATDEQRGNNVLTVRAREMDVAEQTGACGGSELLCLASPVKAAAVQITADRSHAAPGDGIRYTASIRNTGAVALEPGSVRFSLDDALQGARYNGDASAGLDYQDNALAYALPIEMGGLRDMAFTVQAVADGGELRVAAMGGQCIDVVSAGCVAVIRMGPAADGQAYARPTAGAAPAPSASFSMGLAAVGLVMVRGRWGTMQQRFMGRGFRHAHSF